ncbi:MAG: tetratricopeptide repeat protein [Anaerolineales bacterium]|nr:MAG: tetratricopeptide repeat protein [Anaerolineales bacterium]
MRVHNRRFLFHDPGRQSNPWRLLLWGTLILVGISTLRGISAGEIEPLFLPTATATRSATSYREEGTAFFNAGNLDAAIGAYQDALAVNPSDYVGWTELARIQTYSASLLTQDRRRTRMAEARQSIDTAVALAPQDSMANAVKAFVYNWSGSSAANAAERQAFVSEASTAAILAVQLDNRNVLAQAYQAEILVDQQQYDQAQQRAQLAISLDPNSLDTRRVYAYVLEASGAYSAAIEQYQLAAELAPNLTFLYISIGQNYRVLGLHDQALEYFDRAATINSGLGVTDPLPYIAIAKTYARDGEFFAAARNAEQAVTLDPTNPDWYGQLGDIYFRSRNYEGSIPVLLCAVRGCTAEENEGWGVAVVGMPLSDTTLHYYNTFGSVLAALDYCEEAFPILEAVRASYSHDQISMAIVNENFQVCANLAARASSQGTPTPVPADATPTP